MLTHLYTTIHGYTDMLTHLYTTIHGYYPDCKSREGIRHFTHNLLPTDCYTMLGMRLDICFTVNCLEYMALTKCLKHTQWTISLLQQLLSEVNLPINIFIDSTGSKSITLNNIHHKRGTTITVRRLPMEQLASMKLTPMTTSLTSSQRHYHESHMNSSHQDLDSLIIQLREECWKSDDNS